jgi:hypothetical protein
MIDTLSNSQARTLRRETTSFLGVGPGNRAAVQRWLGANLTAGRGQLGREAGPQNWEFRQTEKQGTKSMHSRERKPGTWMKSRRRRAFLNSQLSSISSQLSQYKRPAVGCIAWLDPFRDRPSQTQQTCSCSRSDPPDECNRTLRYIVHTLPAILDFRGPPRLRLQTSIRRLR